MKLSLSFLVFVAVIQFGSSNVLSKSGIQEQLLSDATAVQNGSDVIMAKPGPLDIILVELVFEVCSTKCTADFLVCYEPHPSDKNVLEDNCDKKYGFCITTIGGKISFMKLILHGSPVTCKSDLCFEVKMKNSAISVLSSDGEIAETTTYAPKVKNGVVKLNIINATSDCVVSIKNAIIKRETTAASLTTTIGQQLGRTSTGKNEHASAATTAEPESFFADYWWIFLILGIVLSAIEIGIGVGIYCFLRRKKQKLIPARRQKLQCSEFPVVLQPTIETQKGKTETAVRPDSLFHQCSILSRNCILYSKKEAPKEEKSLPLSNLKQQLLHQQQHHLDNLINLHQCFASRRTRAAPTRAGARQWRTARRVARLSKISGARRGAWRDFFKSSNFYFKFTGGSTLNFWHFLKISWRGAARARLLKIFGARRGARRDF